MGRLVKLLLLSAPLLAAAPVGCGRSSGPSDVETRADELIHKCEPSTTRIGPAGGTVQGTGGLSVIVPADAVHQPIDISTAIDRSLVAPRGFRLAGRTYRIGPSGTTFAKPITVRLPLPVRSDPNDLYPFVVPDDEAEFELLTSDGIRDGKLLLSATHFSKFGVLQVNPPSTGATDYILAVLDEIARTSVKAYLDRLLGDIPPSHANCPCTLLIVRPHKIPLDGEVTFSVGSHRQLEVICDRENVTTSQAHRTLLPTQTGTTLKLAVNITSYSVKEPGIIAVTDEGLVTAAGPGETNVVVKAWLAGASISTSGNRPQIGPLYLCEASGHARVEVTGSVVDGGAPRPDADAPTLPDAGASSDASMPTDACVPGTCADLGANCGSVPDLRCGNVIVDCGSCHAPDTCGGSGVPNICGCTPMTCADRGANCGIVNDGCRSSLDCGSCVLPETCEGGKIANRCGCTPTTCAAAGVECGVIADGCGAPLDCGPCQAQFVLETGYNLPYNNPNTATSSELSVSAGDSSLGYHVTSIAGPASITTTVVAESRIVHGVGGTTFVSPYILGPPGTPFRIAYDWAESVLADSSGAEAASGASVDGFASLGVTAPAGGSGSQSASGSGVDIGFTSAATTTVGGHTYSLAKTYRLAAGAGTPPCPFCGPLVGGLSVATSRLTINVLPPLP